MRVRIGVALCGALVLLGGCGGGDDGEDRAATPTATPEATTAPPEETATPTPTPSAAPGEVDQGTALAEQTVKARGSRSTVIDLSVLSLEVNDELAALTLSYAVQDPKAAPDEEWSLYDLNDQQPLYVSLVDPVNLRRYKVVMDSDGQALESGAVETKVPNEGSTTAQHTFAAPPADVAEIDVAVGDWPAFRDIPITR
jgi:hypothetical protein